MNARYHLARLASSLKWALTVVAILAAPAVHAERGRIIDVEVVDRTDGRLLGIFAADRQRWIVGTPGHEYLLRLRNRTGARVLAVPSVDGVNALTGETASPTQAGYVLEPYATTDIAGWRKNLASTAAFYFTDLGDAYATRTGRPDDVGVIGVAVFRERPRIAELSVEAPPGAPLHKGRADRAESTASAAREQAAGAPLPAPALGTGHGREEGSAAYRVRFDRATTSPAEVVTLRYDRRENLVAMGILRVAPIAGTPRAFPHWSAGFVPDPPAR